MLTAEVAVVGWPFLVHGSEPICGAHQREQPDDQESSAPRGSGGRDGRLRAPPLAVRTVETWPYPCPKCATVQIRRRTRRTRNFLNQGSECVTIARTNCPGISVGVASLGTPGNMPNPARSGPCSVQSERQAVHFVHTPFSASRASHQLPHPASSRCGSSLS